MRTRSKAVVQYPNPSLLFKHTYIHNINTYIESQRNKELDRTGRRKNGEKIPFRLRFRKSSSPDKKINT